jgi:putative transposase
VPWGLKRFQQSRQLHFLTFSCYHRQPKFGTATSRATFESALEQVRQKYDLCVYGYVVMPEHVHMLVNEPGRGTLAQAMQSLKQSVARRLALRAPDPFWQARYYDFNVWSERKFVEKLRYIHRNPVTRGLVVRPEDWAWSSFRHYLSGEPGPVEIESQWTARKRERAGIFPTVRVRPPAENPAQAKLGRATLQS